METMISVEEEKFLNSVEHRTGRLVGFVTRFVIWYIAGITIFVVAMNFAIYAKQHFV